MSQTNFTPESQEIIDRLGLIDFKIYRSDKDKIQSAFDKHLEALGIPTRPVILYSTFKEGVDAARDAAWDAARGAAWDAAWDAAWYAAWDAARGAARDAAWDAARGTARDAAWDAARDAARDAAWYAAWDAARGAARDAARGAAWDAARGAAWDAARGAAMLNSIPKTHPKFREWHAIWMPFTEATEAGLFVFWVTPKAVIGITQPVMQIKDNRLHADGTPAVKWPKGESYYFFNGVKVPEKYGKLKSEQWESKWILSEKNAELRRVLIQGIGYGKIARDLNAKTVDSWKEYELLKIEDADVEPIVMVKMICPSTGLLHAHRVPPKTTSAREAIKWCNWGIDKEEFAIEA